MFGTEEETNNEDQFETAFGVSDETDGEGADTESDESDEELDMRDDSGEEDDI